MVRWVLGVVLAASVVGSAAAAEYDRFRSGQWEGAAIRSDDTGEFTHCVIVDGGSGRIPLLFSIDRDNVLQLVVADRAMHLVIDQKYPVAIDIDGKVLGRYDGSALGESVLGVKFGTDGAEFTALEQGSQLTVRAVQRDYRFSLSGSRQALHRLQSCVDRNVAARGGADPVRPDAPSRNPFKSDDRSGNSGDQSRNPFKAEPSAVPRTYTRKEITAILAAAGMAEPEFLSQAEARRYPEFAHMWWLNSSLGFLTQMPRDTNATVGEQVSGFLGRFTEACKGESVAQPSPPKSQGDFVFVEGLANCTGNDGFFIYSVSIFDARRVSVFGYLVPAGEDRTNASAAMARLIVTLERLYR